MISKGFLFARCEQRDHCGRSAEIAFEEGILYRDRGERLRIA